MIGYLVFMIIFIKIFGMYFDSYGKNLKAKIHQKIAKKKSDS